MENNTNNDDNKIKNFHIKKRILLAILTTIIIIIATNKYWLIFKPMHVSLDIRGNETCNVIVFLNNNDSNDFYHKIKIDKIKIDLNKDNHADLYVRRSKFPKRMRLLITGLQTQNNIYK